MKNMIKVIVVALVILLMSGCSVQTTEVNYLSINQTKVTVTDGKNEIVYEMVGNRINEKIDGKTVGVYTVLPGKMEYRNDMYHFEYKIDDSKMILVNFPNGKYIVNGVNYSINRETKNYNLTVNYIDDEGKILETFTEELNKGYIYPIIAKEIDGYLTNNTSYEFVMPDIDCYVDIVYRAHEHTLLQVDDIDSTCSKDGYTSFKCDECDKKIIEVKELLEHEFAVEETKKATCIEPGEEKHTCEVCGFEEVVETELGEHTYKDSKITKQPTCTETGIKEYYCTFCESQISETLKATGHKFDGGTVTKQATCLEKGSKTLKCTACGFTKEQQISKTDHHFNEGEVVLEPTCTEEGLRHVVCKDCGYFENKPITKIAHKLENTVVTRQPDCVNKGTKVSTCSACGNEIKEEIAALGHAFDSGKVTVEPTTSSTGVRTYTCTRCGTTKTETIPKISPTITEKETDRNLIALINHIGTNKHPYKASQNIDLYLMSDLVFDYVRFLKQSAGYGTLIRDAMWEHIGDYRAMLCYIYGPAHYQEGIWESLWNYDNTYATQEIVFGEILAVCDSSRFDSYERVAYQIARGYYHSSSHWNVIKSYKYCGSGLSIALDNKTIISVMPMLNKSYQQLKDEGIILPIEDGEDDGNNGIIMPLLTERQALLCKLGELRKHRK